MYVFVCLFLSVRALPRPHLSFFISGYFLVACGLDFVGPLVWSPPRPLQNSSSSASSEASETCQSVSECSSPTSVSSGSTMGAWASTEKVTGWVPGVAAPPLPTPPPPAASVTATGTWKLRIFTKIGVRVDKSEGFFLSGCVALSNDLEVVPRERKGYGELGGVKASSQKCCVLIHLPTSTPKHPTYCGLLVTIPLDVTLYCVRGCVLFYLSVCKPPILHPQFGISF